MQCRYCILYVGPLSFEDLRMQIKNLSGWSKKMCSRNLPSESDFNTTVAFLASCFGVKILPRRNLTAAINLDFWEREAQREGERERERENERERGERQRELETVKAFWEQIYFAAPGFHFCKSNLCEGGSNFSNSKHESVGIDVMITRCNNDSVQVDSETKEKPHGLSIIHIYSGSCLMWSLWVRVNLVTSTKW